MKRTVLVSTLPLTSTLNSVLVIHSFTQTNTGRVPHVRTSVRGLSKTGRSPIKGLSFSFPREQNRVPHIPDFLRCFVGSLNFMRLSLKKGAHAALSSAAYRKFGVSRLFFARCGIPLLCPCNAKVSIHLRTGSISIRQELPGACLTTTEHARLGSSRLP